MRGLVIKSTGSSYIVRLDDGSNAECRIKGNFRIRGIRSTNPVAVGDFVETEDGWITDVYDRRNYIIRKSTNLSKESHILAANIDQVALIVTVNHPVTSTTFIDRFLATCEAYRVPAIIIFNKIDLLTDEEQAQLSELRALYESIGYNTFAICAKDLTGEAGLLRELQGRVTLLSGNSGVGKSTLLNALFGREMTRTGRISDAHDKGMHTTTFSEMYFLPDGALIDTPGIKGFGTFDFQREEVSHYFRDIFAVGRNCRFGNCTHTNEPGCAVQEALITGDIAISRYESYLSLLGDCEEGKYR
ncbi:MAG: ribosome small subunit-dependent GTPase A [Paludibacteraceae bacterium]|nr:ribosome small subunit-dependent GTPase A [Paludibacteraceae bacterium]MBR6493391.1 ribosome small subunit-dependent GTPase A [Paludibacteraceae bacterium]